ncbi:MAG: hypothetical protein HC782_03385 [Gammaproteobacteria bacterium]|nr:hypothetical protein [Gammaproteobacteria bacterium]
MSVKVSWDRLVNHPLKWTHASRHVVFSADDASRLSLYKWDITAATPVVIAEGGTVSDFDVGASSVTFVRNNMSNPPKVFVRDDGGERAIEQFNDQLMANFKLGEVREYHVRGWNNERVQMWAVFPPTFDFNAKKKRGRCYIPFTAVRMPTGAITFIFAGTITFLLRKAT